MLNAEWWNDFVCAWNASAHRRTLSGLGAVGFDVVGESESGAWLVWGSDGTACIAAGERPADGILFRATRENWQRFLNGEYRAVIGVLSRRLLYDGPMARIMPYTAAFDRIPEVARGMRPAAGQRG